jgi:hypothetical protein
MEASINHVLAVKYHPCNTLSTSLSGFLTLGSLTKASADCRILVMLLLAGAGLLRLKAGLNLPQGHPVSQNYLAA